MYSYIYRQKKQHQQYKIIIFNINKCTNYAFYFVFQKNV